MAVKRNYVGSTNPKAGYGGYTGPLLGGPYNNGIFDMRAGANAPTASNNYNLPSTYKTKYVAPKPVSLNSKAKPAGSMSAADVASAVALAGGPIPGNIQALLVPKKAGTTAKKSGSKAPAKAVARRVGVPAAPPVDPLDTLRGEYDKYLTDMYAGLDVTLKGNQEQYKTRSQELATRLGQIYDDAGNVAGQTSTRTNEQMASFAASMGLGEALQGRDTADWQQTNERLKSLNEVNRANSMATNDTIRSNYYDFLGDKVASAKGQEAMSRGSLNDIIVQAKLARQQAAAAAAAAAARARSSRGGGGRSSKSPLSGSVSQNTSSTNDELAALWASNPLVREGMLANDPTAAYIMYGSTLKPRTISNGPGSQAIAKQREAAAIQYFVAAAKQGGPKTSSSTKNTLKGG